MKCYLLGCITHRFDPRRVKRRGTIIARAVTSNLIGKLT